MFPPNFEGVLCYLVAATSNGRRVLLAPCHLQDAYSEMAWMEFGKNNQPWNQLGECLDS